jgi:Na+/proline symporter
VASFLLPRQFHMAVVENAEEGHVRTAQWLFPLYLLAANLFVLPLALCGLGLGLPAARADILVLGLPLGAGRRGLALLVFLGGFSAAAAMVMVTATALATMATNHLLLPLIHRPRALAFLRRRLLLCRWACIAGIIGLAFAFERTMGRTAMLADLGMISFAAVLQFAPAMLAGIFGRAASTLGAGLGLAMVKKIVQMHGGTVGVESKPGRGSKFFFTLPKQKERTRDEKH